MEFGQGPCRPIHIAEGLGAVDADQPAPEVVGPGVVRAGKALPPPGARGADDGAAMPRINERAVVGD